MTAKLARTDLTYARACELLVYEPETGFLRWREGRPPVRAGDIAGSVDKDGYRIVGVDYIRYKAARVGWLIHYGAWPDCRELDHKNGIQSDDRIENLRPATSQQNQANKRIHSNNTSGFKGVRRSKGGNWSAFICVNRRQICLGTHPTPEIAHAEYMRAATQHFGEFARAG